MSSPTFSSVMKTIYTLLLTLALSFAAQAQTFTVLHTFHGYDGAAPTGQLVLDSAGNVYGTTSAGGVTETLSPCVVGCGTVFKLNTTGKEDGLYSFQGGNGYHPSAGLLRDTAGNLLGTTVYGGDIACLPPDGCGTVFKLNNENKESVLHEFTGYNQAGDGFFPESLLAEDQAGNLYGTTLEGDEYGTVFKIDSTGNETVLYTFTGGPDGCFAGPGVVLDVKGNLYGVANQGGSGFCNSGLGVVFELDSTGTLTVLHTFSGGDGAYPYSVLLFDDVGNLYGMTESGGSSAVCGGGCGTIFELSPDESGGWSERVLYSFCSLSECADGEEPGTGPLVLDASGNLYGTTYFGGSSGCSRSGCGVVFELSPAGKEAALHSFTGGADGKFPVAGLVMDDVGNLYGTTQAGADLACAAGYGAGCGIVFRLTP